MNNRKPEDIVLDATVGFSLLVVVTALTALLYQLIATAVPLLESPAFSRVNW